MLGACLGTGAAGMGKGGFSSKEEKDTRLQGPEQVTQWGSDTAKAPRPSESLGSCEGKPQHCEDDRAGLRTSLEGGGERGLLMPQGGGIAGDFSFLYCWSNAVWAINKKLGGKNSCSVN